jgi:hypothetical protein
MVTRRPRSIRCANCNKRVEVAPTGRIAVYCSNACRQQAFVKNTRSPLTADDRQRLMIWQVLQDAGLVPADRPLPDRPENSA